MRTKTADEFIREDKPKEAVFTISLDHGFAWAMMTDQGCVCSSANKELRFEDDQPFPMQVEALLSELSAMRTFTHEIEGFMVRLPKVNAGNPEQGLKKVMAVGIIKAFCFKHKIDFAHMQPSEVSEAAFHEARRIMKDHDKNKSEIAALETLLSIAADLDGNDGDNEEFEININIHMAGAA